MLLALCCSHQPIFFVGELARFQAGVTMEISRLDAWYSSSDGSMEGPATYIVHGLCRKCCIPEVALRCMQVSVCFVGTPTSSTHSPPLSPPKKRGEQEKNKNKTIKRYLLWPLQVSVSLMEFGNPPESHDDLIQLVSSPETEFLHLFSQKQIEVRKIPGSCLFLFLLNRGTQSWFFFP